VKAPATTQKLRGGYYTPAPIARFLAEWAIQTASTTILEPSCGDGNVLLAAVEVLLQRGATPAGAAALIHGVEFDADEARRCAARLAERGICASGQIQQGDFFAYCQDRLLEQIRFDAIVGNPPFIRYQNFQEDQRAIAFRLMAHAGLRPTRLTNAWVPFLVAATLLLKERGGRTAMVIPAELLQVNYAAELRRFLSDYYSRITLFTFRKLVFSDIEQEVVLFLGERNGDERTGIRTIELEGMHDLARYEHTDFATSDLKPMDHSREKWTQYFLDRDSIQLLRALREDRRLTVARDVMSVDVGIVTGANDFFIMTEPQAAQRRLTEHTRPIVTRSGHLSGILFTAADLAANAARHIPCRILTAPDAPHEALPEAVQRYVAWGEREGVHTGYKCRIRHHWYVAPSVWTPDAFMLRQVYNYPKMILNQTPATSTDTIHRVRFTSALSAKAVTAAFLNSLTFAFAEVMGRSYGGGVLELEPNEADALPLPLPNAARLDFEVIHALAARGDIEAALDITDRVLLLDGLGLSSREASQLRGTWHRLRDRRVNRKHRNAS